MDPLSSGHYLHFFHSVTTSFIYYTVFSCSLGYLFLVQFISLPHVTFVNFIFPFHTWNEVSSQFCWISRTFCGGNACRSCWCLLTFDPCRPVPSELCCRKQDFPSLVLSILSLWDRGSQDIPLSQIDKGLADPLLDSSSAYWLQPSGHVSFNAYVSCGDEGFKAVTPHRCVCPCVYVCVCVCKITLAAHYQLSPAVTVSLPAPPLNKYSIDVSEMLIWFD